jgi:ribonuclease BN (tRNA processing enzyme)
MSLTGTLTPIGTSAVAFSGETTCFLLDIDGFRLLVDAGTNPARTLFEYGLKLTDVDYVYISHVHADHMQGLPSLVFTRTVQERTATRAVSQLTIVAGPEILPEAQKALTTFYPDRKFAIQWDEHLTAVTAGDHAVELSLFRVHHTVPCYGFTLRVDGDPAFGYTADTAPYAGLAGELAGVPNVLVECFGTAAQFGELTRTAQHLTAHDAHDLVTELKPRLAVPFHMHAPYQREGAPRDSLLAELVGNDGAIWRYPVPGEPIMFDV